MYTTGGTVTDNLAISPGDLATYTVKLPSDTRLPGGGGNTVGPLYNVNPNVFGQSNLLVRSTKDVGDDTRVFNGVDVTVNVRAAHGFTFSGGTGTGKVVNDWCAIRAAVPENTGAGPNGYLLNPYCHVESPVETAFRALATYTIPHIDVLVSSVLQDKPNVGTDQLVSLLANYTLIPADQAAAAAQIGRPLTTTGAITVNLIAPGDVYGSRLSALGFLISGFGVTMPFELRSVGIKRIRVCAYRRTVAIEGQRERSAPESAARDGGALGERAELGPDDLRIHAARSDVNAE